MAAKRFEREISNDLWQIDATQIRLGDGIKTWAVNILDDHSRFLLAALAGTAATTELAWDTFELAASRYGLPQQVLSDNGLAFTGRLHNVEVVFETNLADLGVQPWDLEHLQELLDGFRFHYNRHRPHQGIDDATPAERYEPTTPPLPPEIRLPDPPDIATPDYPPHAILRKVTSVGSVRYDSKHIQVGYRWAGATVRIIHIGEIVHIFYGNHLIRSLTLDPDIEYQPLKPPANRRAQRKTA